MRLCFPFFALVCLLSAPLARADVIYNLTLTSDAGYPGGTGYFALNVAPPSTGTVAYSFLGTFPFTPGYLIDAFSVVYTAPLGGYGVTSDLGSLVSYIQVDDGVFTLSGFTYTSRGNGCGTQFGIDSSSGSPGYSYFFLCAGAGYLGPQAYDRGTVTITPAAAATPEPSSLALLGTGLLGTGCLGFGRTMRRRFL